MANMWRKLWAWLLEICGAHLSLRLKLLVGELPSLAAQAHKNLILFYPPYTLLFKKLIYLSIAYGFSRE